MFIYIIIKLKRKAKSTIRFAHRQPIASQACRISDMDSTDHFDNLFHHFQEYFEVTSYQLESDIGGSFIKLYHRIRFSFRCSFTLLNSGRVGGGTTKLRNRGGSTVFHGRGICVVPLLNEFVFCNRFLGAFAELAKKILLHDLHRKSHSVSNLFHSCWVCSPAPQQCPI